MKISIRVKPRVKESSVEKIDDFNFIVKVKELPIEGKANEAIIEVLAGYFNVSKSEINIVSGHNSKNKIIEIIQLIF